MGEQNIAIQFSFGHTRGYTGFCTIMWVSVIFVSLLCFISSTSPSNQGESYEDSNLNRSQLLKQLRQTKSKLQKVEVELYKKLHESKDELFKKLHESKDELFKKLHEWKDELKESRNKLEESRNKLEESRNKLEESRNKLEELKNEITLKNEMLTNLTEKYKKLEPMANGYLKHNCENGYRRTLQSIEDTYVTNIEYVKRYESFYNTMLECIDYFNRERKKKGNCVQLQVNKTYLEAGGKLKKTHFSRFEKWYLLTKWFVILKKNEYDSGRLEILNISLLDFRKALLHEFQGPHRKFPVSDSELPDKIGHTMRKAWDMVSANFKGISDDVRKEDFESALTLMNFADKNLKKSCVELIVKSIWFRLSGFPIY